MILVKIPFPITVEHVLSTNIKNENMIEGGGRGKGKHVIHDILTWHNVLYRILGLAPKVMSCDFND